MSEYKGPPSGARVIQVIETDLFVAGDGTSNSPYRRIVQYYSLEGHLLAQVDTADPPAFAQQFSDERTQG